MDYGVSRRVVIVALALLGAIYLIRFAPRDAFSNTAKYLATTKSDGDAQDIDSLQDGVPYVQIKDKVAVLSDTQYSPRLIPLILHFHGVLGPDWPIVFYTTEENIAKHLQPEGTAAGSAVWRRAVADGRIQVRVIPPEFDLASRDGVNLYLSKPWLWESLAPAQHVLVFQTDAIVCGNSHRTLDDFLDWDWIGAPMHGSEKYFNGGLSLRNRTMILDILREGHNWEAETKSGEWTMGGEDIWFSRKMEQRGARLPDVASAVQFACEHEWHIALQKEPFGYHKVHKYAASKLNEIALWCPEIALAAPGTLAQ